jgi:hypothetical protein
VKTGENQRWIIGSPQMRHYSRVGTDEQQPCRRGRTASLGFSRANVPAHASAIPVGQLNGGKPIRGRAISGACQTPVQIAPIGAYRLGSVHQICSGRGAASSPRRRAVHRRTKHRPRSPAAQIAWPQGEDPEAVPTAASGPAADACPSCDLQPRHLPTGGVRSCSPSHSHCISPGQQERTAARQRTTGEGDLSTTSERSTR